MHDLMNHARTGPTAIQILLKRISAYTHWPYRLAHTGHWPRIDTPGALSSSFGQVASSWSSPMGKQTHSINFYASCLNLGVCNRSWSMSCDNLKKRQLAHVFRIGEVSSPLGRGLVVTNIVDCYGDSSWKSAQSQYGAMSSAQVRFSNRPVWNLVHTCDTEGGECVCNTK